jgi:hypothetical protein
MTPARHARAIQNASGKLTAVVNSHAIAFSLLPARHHGRRGATE